MARKKGKGQPKTDHVWKYFGDGIWEIAFGLMVIWGGVIIRLKWSILWVLPSIMLLLVVYGLKKKYIFPHAKKIRLPKIRKRATTELIILTGVILFVMLTLLKSEPGFNGYWIYIQENSLTLIGIISAIVCLFIAFISKVSPYFLHAIMLLITFFLDASAFKEQPFGMAIGAGVVMLVSGVVAFRQFLHSQ